MVCEKLICAGFGGQGVMSLGQLLAYAGMIEDKQVTWMPSYGPEMRGGTAYCCVVVSDCPVGSPLITDDATAAIVMNQPSFEKFAGSIVPGGLLLVNSSLVARQPVRDDLQVYYLAALDAAAACGNRKAANMVMLGAYLELTGIVSQKSIMAAFAKVFGAKARQLQDLNRLAMARGAAMVHEQLGVPAAA